MIGHLDLFLSGLIKKRIYSVLFQSKLCAFLKLFIRNGVFDNSNERTKKGLRTRFR